MEKKKSKLQKNVKQKQGIKKKLTKHQKEKIKLQKRVIKGVVKELNISSHRKGYFKKEFTGYELKALKKIVPAITDKQLAGKLGMSKTTYSKILNGKKVSSKSLKKVSALINSLDNARKLQISLTAEKLFKGVKNPDTELILKKIKKAIKKVRQNIFDNIDNIDLKVYY